MSKSNFFEFLANGVEGSADASVQDKVVQDQDTVVSDAMVETADLFYKMASSLQSDIDNHRQESIDIGRIHRAQQALAFMEGVSFGLALDNKIDKWYLLEMRKSMATIIESWDNAFKFQIYVPPSPSYIFGYDDIKVDGKCYFLPLDWGRPYEKSIEEAKKEIMEDKDSKFQLQKAAERGCTVLLAMFPDLRKEVPEDGEVPEEPVPDEADGDKAEDSKAEDDSPSVLSLRNLYRQNKIDKDQYVGSLATLLATGLINKSQFTRLKAGA